MGRDGNGSRAEGVRRRLPWWRPRLPGAGHSLTMGRAENPGATFVAMEMGVSLLFAVTLFGEDTIADCLCVQIKLTQVV